MTKPNHTLIVVVMDRSGSMTSIRDATIEGFNEFLKQQREQPGSCEIYYTQFDHEYEVVHPYVSLDLMPNLDHGTYAPRGNTALLDAIGRTINAVGANLSDRQENARPEKVIFVVQTDGQENASRQYSRRQIFDLIAQQRDQWSWQFIFLGASQESINEAMALGMDRGQTMYYAHSAGGQGAAMAGVSAMVSDSRMGASRNFSDEERKAASDA